MPSFVDTILSMFQMIWGLWPFLFLVALEFLPRRKRKQTNKIYLVVRNSLILWLLWAFMNICLQLSGRPLYGFLIPEPANSAFFWMAGSFLFLLLIPLFYKQRQVNRNLLKTATSLSQLLTLSPSEFERLVAETYHAFGNKVEIVAAQGDHGVDLIIFTPRGEKNIVQCKRYKGKVGEPTVRDFYGAMQHENAVEGAIVTTGEFTLQAIQWAQGKPIRLYNGEEFLKVLQRAQDKKNHRTEVISPSSTNDPNSKTEAPRCPKCGIPMVVRVAQKGPHQGEAFYGCPNYPSCRVILPSDEQQNKLQPQA